MRLGLNGYSMTTFTTFLATATVLVGKHHTVAAASNCSDEANDDGLQETCEDIFDQPVYTTDYVNNRSLSHLLPGANQCAGTESDQQCVPECESGYTWHGDPARCDCDEKRGKLAWYTTGKCKPSGVRRVGIGIYVLNIGKVSVEDHSFHVDFLMTILTEKFQFKNYKEALQIFPWANGHRDRVCNPRLPSQLPNSRKSWDLGAKNICNSTQHSSRSGSVKTCEGDPNRSKYSTDNGFLPLSPSQFLHFNGYRLSATDLDPNSDQKKKVTVDLDKHGPGMQFVNLDPGSLQYSRVTLGSSTPSWRVSGIGSFKPEYADWPFAEQTLNVIVEDLEIPLKNNISFVTCQMTSLSGVRHAIKSSVDSFSASMAEVCWPPKGQVDHKSEMYGDRFNESCSSKGNGALVSSRFIYTATTKPAYLTSFMQNILPVAIIAFINSMAYLTPFDAYSLRVNICIGTLTMLCLLHLSASAKTPGSNVASFGTCFVIMCYILNAISWMSALSIMAANDNEKLCKTITVFFRWASPVATYFAMWRFVQFSTRAELFLHWDEVVGFYFLGAVIGLLVQAIEVKLTGYSLSMHPVCQMYKIVRKKAKDAKQSLRGAKRLALRSMDLISSPHRTSHQAEDVCLQRMAGDCYEDEDAKLLCHDSDL